MAAKTASSTAADTYLELVKQFRLVPVKDDNHLKAAHEMIDRLLREDLDPAGQDYLGVLADLVEAYEDVHLPIPDASEIDVLRELMRSNNLSQTDLAKKVGIVQSTISAVLKGRRKLTKNQVIKLAEFFNVAPAAFLPSRATDEEKEEEEKTRITKPLWPAESSWTKPPRR
jgi:HTH-type transcriptional regulator / antitoxin HigA